MALSLGNAGDQMPSIYIQYTWIHALYNVTGDFYSPFVAFFCCLLLLLLLSGGFFFVPRWWNSVDPAARQYLSSFHFRRQWFLLLPLLLLLLLLLLVTILVSLLTALVGFYPTPSLSHHPTPHPPTRFDIGKSGLVGWLSCCIDRYLPDCNRVGAIV